MAAAQIIQGKHADDAKGAQRRRFFSQGARLSISAVIASFTALCAGRGKHGSRAHLPVDVRV